MNKSALFFGGFSNLYSCKFDGINDYVTAGGVSDFNYYHGATNTSAFAFTISVWVKFNSLATAQIFLANSVTGSSGIGIYMALNTNRRIDLQIARGVAGSANVVIGHVTASNAYPNSTGWVNLIWTYNQALASANSNIYVNNVLASTGNKTGQTPSTANASGAMNFGRLRDATFLMAGRIYHPIFINKVLSLAERNELYAAPYSDARKLSFGANVTNAYRFPQGQNSFNIWQDYAGGISGTMTNQTSADIVLDRP